MNPDNNNIINLAKAANEGNTQAIEGLLEAIEALKPKTAAKSPKKKSPPEKPTASDIESLKKQINQYLKNPPKQAAASKQVQLCLRKANNDPTAAFSLPKRGNKRGESRFDKKKEEEQVKLESHHFCNTIAKGNCDIFREIDTENTEITPQKEFAALMEDAGHPPWTAKERAQFLVACSRERGTRQSQKATHKTTPRRGGNKYTKRHTRHRRKIKKTRTKRAKGSRRRKPRSKYTKHR